MSDHNDHSLFYKTKSVGTVTKVVGMKLRQPEKEQLMLRTFFMLSKVHVKRQRYTLKKSRKCKFDACILLFHI